MVHGIGRIDVSGRIAARAVIGALGWRGGDWLTLTADAGVVTANRDPDAWLPCGLLPGDRVLLAVEPGDGTLTVYSLVLVHQAIPAHGTLRRCCFEMVREWDSACQGRCTPRV